MSGFCRTTFHERRPMSGQRVSASCQVQQSKLREEPTLRNLQAENAELHRRLEVQNVHVAGKCHEALTSVAAEVFYKAMEFEADGQDADPTEEVQENKNKMKHANRRHRERYGETLAMKSGYKML